MEIENKEIKHRLRNPEERLEALKAKYIGQPYGDYTCIDVFIVPKYCHRQVNNVPFLKLKCTACGEIIERRADRYFRPQCTKPKCLNGDFNRKIKTYITTLRRGPQNFAEGFLEFDTFKSFLLSKGVKPGDKLPYIRPERRGEPIDASNCRFWACKGTFTYKLPDGSYLDLPGLCKERRVKYETARTRWARGERDVDKLVPPLEPRIAKYEQRTEWTELYEKDPEDPHLYIKNMVTLKPDTNWIRFRSGEIEKPDKLAREFDLDPEYLIRLQYGSVEEFCQKWKFDVEEMNKLSDNGLFKGAIVLKIVKDKDSRFYKVRDYWQRADYKPRREYNYDYYQDQEDDFSALDSYDRRSYGNFDDDEDDFGNEGGFW